MIIKESVYKQIISYCPLVPPETGGIIGSSSTFIDTVVYVPDVRRLNAILSSWQKDKISFCGLFHSHKKGQETLSKDDIEYIHTIYSCLPQTITNLYFPIVIPQTKIFPYKAINQKHSIEIISDRIDLVP